MTFWPASADQRRYRAQRARAAPGRYEQLFITAIRGPSRTAAVRRSAAPSVHFWTPVPTEYQVRSKPSISDVLLDVTMPELDGYWLGRRLRETEAGGWTPIIF